MGRKSGVQAQLSVTQERWARFRFMLRNKQFQEDLRFIRRNPQECVEELGTPMLYAKRLAVFEGTWGIRPFLFDTTSKEIPPDLSPETVRDFERIIIHRGIDTYLPFEEIPVERFTLGDLDEALLNTMRSGDVFLKINLRHTPLHILMGLIEKEIKEASKDSKLFPFIDGYQREGKRLRLNSIDFHLKVYDEVTTYALNTGILGYQVVGQRLKRSRTTIRSAYWSACYKIGVDGMTRGEALHSPGEFDKCRNQGCLAAQNESDLQLMIKGLCKAHRIYYQKFLVTPSHAREI